MALRNLSPDPLSEPMTATFTPSLADARRSGGGGRRPEEEESARLSDADGRLPLPLLLGASALLHLLLFAGIAALPEPTRSLSPFEDLAVEVVTTELPPIAEPEPEPEPPQEIEPPEPEPPQAAIARRPEPRIDRPEPAPEEPPPAAEEPADAAPVMTAEAGEAAAGAGSVYSGRGIPGGEPGGTGTGTGPRREGSPDGTPGGAGDVRPSRGELVALLRRWKAEQIRYVQGHASFARAARRSGEEGRVRVRVRLHPDGTLVAVSVVGSSGSSVLDDAATSGIQRLGQLLPIPAALPQREGSFTMNVDFTLED